MYILKSEPTELFEESIKHFKNRQFKLALTTTQKIYIENPEDPVALSYYAWANLENGNPTYALELSDLAVMNSQGELTAKLFRGYFLYRMGIYQGALNDLEIIKSDDQEFYHWSQLNKARTLAALGQFGNAFLLVNILCSNGKSEDQNYQYVKELISVCKDYQDSKSKNINKKGHSFPDDAQEAFERSEFWFSYWEANEMIQYSSSEEDFHEAVIILIRSLIKTFQFKLALQKIEQFKIKLKDEPDFQRLEKIISKHLNKTGGSQNTNLKERSPNNKINIDIVSARTFKFDPEIKTQEKVFLKQFDEKSLTYVGIETIAINPFYKNQSKNINGLAIWYLNDIELGRDNFTIYMDKDWEKVEFIQSWGNDVYDYWTTGSGRVEIYLENELKVNKHFEISVNEIEDNVPDRKSRYEVVTNPNHIDSIKSNEIHIEENLSALLARHDKFIGLENVKRTMRDFIDYLQFINERKKLGLKSNEKLSINCIFLGNPGTGKTTMARLLGKIFKSMGLLEKGHVVEVDRAALVGQYIGETAQKTEKVINNAMGGLLFIDEAYSLSKPGNGQDFGQEAVDILLKRMEDREGEFAVIAAGYPQEMQTFINSNPGLKSRFNYQFNFEDYTPEELIKIFKQFAQKEEFSIEQNAIEILHKKLTDLYRKRDKNFGNARLVKNYFNELKLQVGKRVLKSGKQNPTKENLSAIIIDDVREIFEDNKSKKINLKIDEEKLTKSLNELNNLTGLDPVKKEINELVKLARYFNERGENIQERFSFHYVFLGNPGTGKTTVARLFGQIYSALGILPKGHLVETDRQTLVGSYIGETAIKTSKIIDEAIGGTLFIDEAYSLIKHGESRNSDFGSEAVDTLIKRMEDDRGKFITIAAGYTENMTIFLQSNPGIQSRFTHKIEFEDYNPDQLLKITEDYFTSKNYKLSGEAKLLLKEYYEDLYDKKDNSFGNARLTRNIAEKILKNYLLRISEIPQSTLNGKISQTIEAADIKKIILRENNKIRINDNKNIDKYLDELDNLAGLTEVKKSINKLVAGLKVARLKEEHGLPLVYKNLNCIFTGNRGTGKRTVARLLANILKEMGIISKGHVFEAGRAELVSDYPWELKSKILSTIQKSLGGILFIDNIDGISKNSKDFIYDLTGILINEIEEKKNQFVVVASGTNDGTKDFLDKFPVFKSQFNNYFYFEDFTPRQMLEIALALTEKHGYKLDEGAWQVLLDRFAVKAPNIQNELMNARYIETIINKSILNQEERFSKLYTIENEDLSTITIEDIEKVNMNRF